jgi:phosphoribosylanthranilate isomerase
VKVKICGVRTAEEAHLCEELGADAIGFIHYPGRIRSLPLSRIREICGTLGPMVTRVLICKPQGPLQAIDMLDRSGADVLQTYSLSPLFVSRVREEGARIIRAIPPEIDEARRYARVANALVFEAGVPGTGSGYDYSIVPLDACEKAIIAGGLHPGNVDRVKELDPYGVDTSSGVEIDGRKDPHLVEEFIRRCKE